MGSSRRAAFAFQRKLTRAKFREFFSGLEPCRVGMEACGSAHYWARELGAMGHEVVLIAPAYAKPYVKRGKNDAADAAAICEAMSRPEMRFVPIKSADQQAVLMLHKTRDLLVKQRTMSVNALRGHLQEFGLIAAKGIDRVRRAGRPGAGGRGASRRGQGGGDPLAEHERATRHEDRRAGEANRQGQREESDEPLAGRDSRASDPLIALGDGREPSRSERVQIGTRFRRVSRPHARAKTPAAARRSSAPSPSRATDT